MATQQIVIKQTDFAQMAVDKYPPPFTPYDYQMKAVRDLFHCERLGLYAEVGCGKTFMATYLALAWQIRDPFDQVIVTMPPILLAGWKRWLESIPGAGSVLVYRGTPKEREVMDVARYKWILMSMQVFKSDNDMLAYKLRDRKLVGIIDEATCVKNSASQNFKYTREFFDGHRLMLLTGTPLSNPGDTYAYVKLVTPIVYRSRGQFENIHVEERDAFNTIAKWRWLDLMKQNLERQAVRIIKEDVLPHLDQPLYVPIYYDLELKHKRLYEQLAEEQLLLLENGGNIDATSASRLYNALQQIILNYDYFSGNEKAVSAGYELVDSVFDEIDPDRKLILFANYRMTNRGLLKTFFKYNAVACYSEVPSNQQERNVASFLDNPQCRLMIAQPISAGAGWNPQYVCSDELFLEMPIVPKDFHQAVGRVCREGQTRKPVIRIAIAKGTIQERLYNNLLAKDSLVNKVQRSFQDLREAIHGQ